MFKNKHLKEIEVRKHDVKGQLLITESFTRYCQEMKDKGSSCDTSRAANDLHIRAEELVKTHQTCKNVKLRKFGILFTTSLLTTDDVQNYIGELSYNGIIDF